MWNGLQPVTSFTLIPNPNPNPNPSPNPNPNPNLTKVRFFMEFMRGGFDVLCADLDVIWLKDPTPWLTGEADPTALLLNFPDVIVSTDVTHGGADSDEQLWGMGQEMNTGMLMLR